MKRLLLLLVLIAGTCGYSYGQQDDPKPPQEEEYEGLLPVLGYLGDKLVGELKTRFNLEEESDTVPKVETKVNLKIGSFEIETVEMRSTTTKKS